MDFLDSDSDNDQIAKDESETTAVKDPRSGWPEAIAQAFYIELMRLRIVKKTSSTARCPWLRLLSDSIDDRLSGSEEIVLHRHIAIVGRHNYINYPLSADSKTLIDECINSLMKKLKSAKFSHVTILDEEEGQNGNDVNSELKRFDIVVVCDFLGCVERLSHIHDGVDNLQKSILTKGGLLLAAIPLPLIDSKLFPSKFWEFCDKTSIKKIVGDNIGIASVSRRCVDCNEKGAMSILGVSTFDATGAASSSSSPSIPSSPSHSLTSSTINPPVSPIDHERALISSVCVPLTIEECCNGILSDASHKRAVDCLNTHGLVILPGLYRKQDVMDYGKCAVEDMSEALDLIKSRFEIDILNPREGQQINNFHEISMREALRCDLRNGPRMKARNEQLANKGETLASTTLSKSTSITTTPASVAERLAIIDKNKNVCQDLRTHPAVMSILQEVMNPISPRDVTEAKGNWGRWNFEGKGPESGPPGLVVGRVGCVMNFPGCCDQTIHADTSHLYVHTPQLPPHYVNQFCVAVDTHVNTSFEVGQTAFVVGSHTLSMSSKIMTQQGGDIELRSRLIRPHLVAGDALLFDCRILHFGMANQSTHSRENSEAWRPLLYVNYWQEWFSDPKNWDDRQRLF